MLFCARRLSGTVLQRCMCFPAVPCLLRARARELAALASPAPRPAPATSDQPRRKPVAEFVTELRNLTPKDITAVVGKMLKSPISVAAIGDITDIPRYNELSSRFG